MLALTATQIPTPHVIARSVAIGLAATLLAASCTSSAASDTQASSTGGSDELHIVASTEIWGNITRSLLCEQPGEQASAVQVLLPANVDPHGFALSLQDRATLDEADLVIANGLHLEGNLGDILDAVQADGGHAIQVGDELAATQAEPPAAASNDDPHLWLDPIQVAAGARLIGEELATYTDQSCLRTLENELTELDMEIADLVETIPVERRILVTNHDSLGYFAERYGFEVVGTVLPSQSSLAQANPADLQRLEALIQELNVPALFSDAGHGSPDAAALADRLSIPVVDLQTSALGDAETYREWLLDLATTIAKTLS